VIHYFSRHLVAFFWHDQALWSKNVGETIRKMPGLEWVNLGREFRRDHHTTARIYLSLPQLLSYDLYISLREELGSGLRGKNDVINRACKRIGQLPPSGWKISRWKATLLKPYCCQDVFLVFGTAFDLVCRPWKRTEIARLYEYSGKDFCAKLDEIMTSDATYAQLIQAEERPGIYWNIYPALVRRGLKRKFKKPNEIKKSDLRKDWR